MAIWDTVAITDGQRLDIVGDSVGLWEKMVISHGIVVLSYYVNRSSSGR